MAGRQGPAVPGWGLHPSGTAQGEAGGSSQAISGCSSEGGNSLKRKQPGFATSTSALHLGSLAEELHEAGSLQLKKR